jgi:AcrR family transcriptional regulator
MKTQNTDRRSQRTRRLLVQALIDLLRERDYDQIGIGDIIERADVGRSTFYAHYEDKDDLLVSGLEGQLEDMNQHASLDGLTDPRGSPILQLFKHVQEYHYLYKALSWSKGIEPLFRKSQLILTQKFEQFLSGSARYKVSPKLPLTVVATYMAGSVITLLRWWLDNNLPYTPEEMDGMFHQLVMPGLWAALEEK